MNYPKKPGFNLYQSRHCAYITYSVKSWYFKKISVIKLQKVQYITLRFLKHITKNEKKKELIIYSFAGLKNNS